MGGKFTSAPNLCPLTTRLLTPSVLVADVGKAPDVAQIDGKSYHGQKEIHLFTPGVPGVPLVKQRAGPGGLGASRPGKAGGGRSGHLPQHPSRVWAEEVGGGQAHPGGGSVQQALGRFAHFKGRRAGGEETEEEPPSPPVPGLVWLQEQERHKGGGAWVCPQPQLHSLCPGFARKNRWVIFPSSG